MCRNYFIPFHSVRFICMSTCCGIVALLFRFASFPFSLEIVVVVVRVRHTAHFHMCATVPIWQELDSVFFLSTFFFLFRFGFLFWLCVSLFLHIFPSFNRTHISARQMRRKMERRRRERWWKRERQMKKRVAKWKARLLIEYHTKRKLICWFTFEFLSVVFFVLLIFMLIFCARRAFFSSSVWLFSFQLLRQIPHFNPSLLVPPPLFFRFSCRSQFALHCRWYNRIQTEVVCGQRMAYGLRAMAHKTSTM